MANTTQVEATINKTNGNGFLTSELGWLNCSKYAKEADVQMPSVGARVLLTLDGSNFVRKIEAIGAAPNPTNGKASMPEQAPVQASPEPRTQAIASLADAKDLRITRLACINSAIALLYGTGGRGYTDEMLDVAAKLESWVLR